jgi:predicted transcriptional regulator of viral defense system
MQAKAMDLHNLHERQIIAVAKTEQAMAWLVANGPLVVDPPLPNWLMKSLERSRRVMRLRRGIYLVPKPDGRLPSLPRAMNMLDEDGYVTGHGALAAQGLNDQDVSRWWAVGSRRQSDIVYGLYRAHFVFSPEAAVGGERAMVSFEGEQVRMATATQALVDEARLMPFGFDWVETARVLSNAVAVDRTDEERVIRVLRKQPSLAATRRLGLLFELVRGEPHKGLLELARRSDTISRVSDGRVTDPPWRIGLPFGRDHIRRAMK